MGIEDREARREECYFGATHTGAELDLLIVAGDRRRGFEIKRTTGPRDLNPPPRPSGRDGVAHSTGAEAHGLVAGPPKGGRRKKSCPKKGRLEPGSLLARAFMPGKTRAGNLNPPPRTSGRDGVAHSAGAKAHGLVAGPPKGGRRKKSCPKKGRLEPGSLPDRAFMPGKTRAGNLNPPPRPSGRDLAPSARPTVPAAPPPLLRSAPDLGQGGSPGCGTGRTEGSCCDTQRARSARR